MLTDVENDIDIIMSKKKELKEELLVCQRKMLEIETEIMKLETKLARFTEMNIADTLVLSPQQKAIVESKEKNIMVIACPGSGKTHTLVSRYIHLVTKMKVDPNNVILITFTKKAGMEMSERINNIIPNKPPNYVGSLHGLGFRLLQQYNKVGYTVLDETDAHTLIRKCADKMLENSGLEDDEVGMLRKQIVYIYDKISTCYPQNLTDTIKNLSISAKYKAVITSILKEYKNTKKNQDLVDFNDLMISFCQLLGTKKITPFLESAKYIFFDEYQDVNPVQNYILGCFKNHSNIMVVGDDAQAIYAFRGSSVKYIWDFEKNFDNVKTYYLETNYRSTPAIVNFFQDIISHNINQFKKNVQSVQTEQGLKPCIVCHKSMQDIDKSKLYHSTDNIKVTSDQYKDVANDIAMKRASGIPLKKMVVLARKNSALDRLEHELIRHSIPVVKSIGISLLNKVHVKDFIAFLTILTNKKSSIHWKRILALHRHIGIVRANEIVEYDEDKYENIMDAIKDNNHLTHFYNNMNMIQNKPVSEQIHMVMNYLTQLWTNNNETNMETREKDIMNLMMYMKQMSNQTIDEFINNIHLNLEIDNYDDSLFLSTVHGAKGLEWEHVYIIDMDNVNFPNVRQAYFRDEIDNSMEERRLFYVAASRAMKYLYIHYSPDKTSDIIISPFVRELSVDNYLGMNIVHSSKELYKFTGNVSEDVRNYIRFFGYNEPVKMILSVPSVRTNIGLKTELPAPATLKTKKIAGNMMDLLAMKMIYCNFPNITQGFELPQNNHRKLPEKVYHNYIDKYTDWRNILTDIFYISTIDCKPEDIDIWKAYLISDTAKTYYTTVEKGLVRFINDIIKNKEDNTIRLQMNVNYEKIKGRVDLIVNDTLVEMKTASDDACTFPAVCQAFIYGYLLFKNNITINNIAIMNLWDGTLDTFDMNNNNLFKYKKFRRVIYDTTLNNSTNEDTNSPIK
jgi:DNA helicase-2/ATP-dependent DNA helicase PcrA